MSEPFANVIDSEAELRDVYRTPAESTKMKVLGALDQHARTFIDASPFILVGTASPDGTADVSPKGGPPGFVVVLDDQRIAIPDLSGNNLLDSLTNIVAADVTAESIDETLEVNYAKTLWEPGGKA